MLVTDAIVLRAVKYAETSMVADLYTREEGLVSCIAGGVRKKRSSMPASLFQLLQPVNAVIYFKGDSQLNRIKELKPTTVFPGCTSKPYQAYPPGFLFRTPAESGQGKRTQSEAV